MATTIWKGHLSVARWTLALNAEDIKRKCQDTRFSGTILVRTGFPARKSAADTVGKHCGVTVDLYWREMILNPLSYLSPKVAVAKSPIHGRGLFALEDLRVGEIVCVKGGHIFTRAILNSVAPVRGHAEIQIADDLFIGPIHPEEREGCMVFSNHACDPNIGVQGADRVCGVAAHLGR